MFDASGEWWAVMTKAGPRSTWRGPALVTIDGNSLAWDGGPSGYTIHTWENIKMLKQYENDYEMDTNEWWDRVEELRGQFEIDFPPEPKLKVSAGWLAPNGKFYPCNYMEHLDMAYRLAFIFYDSNDGEKKLEEEGWAKVWTDGMIILGDWEAPRSGYKQAQIDTLGDLLVLSKKEDRETYAANISAELKSIKEIR